MRTNSLAQPPRSTTPPVTPPAARADGPAHADATAPIDGAPGILLLVADHARQARMRALVQAVLPDARLASETNPIDALLQAAREPVDLVLADGALVLADGGRARRLAPALAQQLGRMAPRVAMLLLDDDAPSVPGRTTVPWHAAPAWIRRWAAARAPRAGLTGADHPPNPQDAPPP